MKKEGKFKVGDSVEITGTDGHDYHSFNTGDIGIVIGEDVYKYPVVDVRGEKQSIKPQHLLHKI